MSKAILGIIATPGVGRFNRPDDLVLHHYDFKFEVGPFCVFRPQMDRCSPTSSQGAGMSINKTEKIWHNVHPVRIDQAEGDVP